jgi:hypothetical protein
VKKRRGAGIFISYEKVKVCNEKKYPLKLLESQWRDFQ